MSTLHHEYPIDLIAEDTEASIIFDGQIGSYVQSPDQHYDVVAALDQGDVSIEEWYQAAGIAPVEHIEQRQLNLKMAIAWLAMGGTIERDGVVLDGSKIFGSQSFDASRQ